MSAPAPTIRILVCGSADRGDDGAAMCAVAHVLRAALTLRADSESGYGRDGRWSVAGCPPGQSRSGWSGRYGA